MGKDERGILILIVCKEIGSREFRGEMFNLLVGKDEK